MRTLLFIPLAVIVLATVLVASVLAGQAFTGYRDSLIAMQDVERLRVLLTIQMKLSLERIAINAAMAVERPMPEAIARQLAATRHNSDSLIETALAIARQDVGKDGEQGRSYAEITALAVSLEHARHAADEQLARERPDRSYADIRAAADLMVGVVPLFEAPVLDAVVHATTTDPGLAGLLNAARLAVTLREYAGRVANVFAAHITGHQPMNDGEILLVRTLSGRVVELDRQLGEALRIAAADVDAQRLLDVARAINGAQIEPFLEELIETGGRSGRYGISAGDFAVRYQVWSNAIVAVWEEVLRQATARVNHDRAVTLRWLQTAVGSIIAVVAAVLAALLLLHHNVVVPVTRIGGTLVRIASGDRTAPLLTIRGPQEIKALAAAVEALRQTALVADATETRERLATRQRASLLHQALTAAQTVREPAHLVEEIAARLVGHLDAARAEIAAFGTSQLLSLDVASEAVRDSVATLQKSSAMADAAVDALHEVNIDGHLGAAQELSSRLVTLDGCVDSWDAAVKNFSQPVLVALQAMAEAARRPDHRGVADARKLLDGPFRDVQEVVATVARMRDALARAGETLKAVAREEVRAVA